MEAKWRRWVDLSFNIHLSKFLNATSANDPTAGSQESTEVKDEPNIYPAEAPSTSVGIDDIKLEDNIQLDGPPVTTEVVKEEYVISDHQDSIAPLSYLCVSLTKPCKVVLKRWVKSCNNDKSKDPLEKNGNTDQDTSDQRNLNEARQENETIINGLEPVVQKENLPASRMTKSREKGVKKLKP